AIIRTYACTIRTRPRYRSTSWWSRRALALRRERGDPRGKLARRGDVGRSLGGLVAVFEKAFHGAICLFRLIFKEQVAGAVDGDAGGEHELLDALRPVRGEAHRDLAAERVADDRGAVDAELVHEADDEAGLLG